MESEIDISNLTEWINSIPFPEAKIGDLVTQYGVQFKLTETGWTPVEGATQ